MTKTVRLGALDWRRADWSGRFYPPDMPEDWRLAFYSSQFNCVYLMAENWQAATSADLHQWCDDVHSQFLFLLENGENSTPLRAIPPDALVRKAVMIAHGDPRLVWFDRDSDLKMLSRTIQSDLDGQDLFLISRDGDLGQMERVATLLELLGW